MTRVIAGAAGGRRLAVPPGTRTRPTSERVREAIFSRLDHLGVLTGARVLDLYAGSGALGLEALSRGAAEVVLVESSPRVAALTRRNAAVVGPATGAGVARVVIASVTRALAEPPVTGPADLVLIDPPYDLGEEELAAVLRALVVPGRLAEDPVVVVERSVRSPEPAWPSPLRPFAERRYGQTRVWFAEGAAHQLDSPA